MKHKIFDNDVYERYIFNNGSIPGMLTSPSTFDKILRTWTFTPEGKYCVEYGKEIEIQTHVSHIDDSIKFIIRGYMRPTEYAIFVLKFS